MRTPILFQLAPHLSSQANISWVPLILSPTPVHEFSGAFDLLGHRRLYVKREDATDTLYGGNKVRNLEFLLGTALARGARRLVTVAPYGSNFVAALAAQAKKIGLVSNIFHFIPDLSAQMQMHAHFSAEQGSHLRLFRGGRYFGLARAQAGLLIDRLFDKDCYVLPAGGSNAVGVLGHINAVFELQSQIQCGEIPEPDFLVVGVGTCGTMAGLLAGIKLTGLKTRVIGVRCVDPVVCNPLHIAYLANSALKLLRAMTRIRIADIDLREGERIAYGRPLPQAEEAIKRVRRVSGIELDTTYTTKVFAYLERLAHSGKLEGKDILFWNTFSPAAVRGLGNAGGRQPLVEREYLGKVAAL